MRSIVLLLLLTIPVLASVQHTSNRCILKSEYIYQPEDVVYPSCHASTIAENKGSLIVAWFGGTAERNPDVGIWVSCFSEGKWSKPVEVVNGIQYKGKRYPCWNPVLYNSGKEILLFYKVGPSPSTWWGEMTSSSDNGKTWGRPYRLPEDITGPVKNKPVLLKNGYLLCPSSTENEGWRVHVEMTTDNGRSWERTEALNDKKTGAIQPTFLLHGDSTIQMLCRSTQSKILTSWSYDNGRTWNELTPTLLPNPNSGIDAVTLKDGRHLLVYNHLTQGRKILNIAVSDDGKEWKASTILENEQDDSEFSYPAIIQSSDGLVHITYTWNRKLIKHVVIDPSLIAVRPFSGGNWPKD